MKTDISLQGVDPMHRQEIRRRVAILDEFTAIVRPTAADRERYAEQMGLAVSSLYRLASIWRANRSPAKLLKGRSKTKQRRKSSLPERTVQLARGIIAEMGPSARGTAITKEILQRCEAAGIRKPSTSSIGYMIREARGATESLCGPSEILIDECVFKMAVLQDGLLAMPRVLMAMLLPQRRILAFEIGLGSSSIPPLETFASRISGIGWDEADAPRIRIPLSMSRISSFDGLDVKYAVGGAGLSRLMGSEIGGIPVGYRRISRRHVDQLVSARVREPISPPEAELLIAEAIARHNDQVPPAMTSQSPAGISPKPLIPGTSVPSASAVEA